jgi:hypothetical protein
MLNHAQQNVSQERLYLLTEPLEIGIRELMLFNLTPTLGLPG